MKRLAVGILALGLVAGVTACGPSDEEKQRQTDCVQKYVQDHWRKIDTQEALDKLNKELEGACKVNPGFIRQSK